MPPDGAIDSLRKHTVEEYMKLTVLSREVEKEENIGEWRTRHLGGREKGKGDVGVENEGEKEEQKREKRESLFCSIYECRTDAERFDVTSSLCNSADFADDVLDTSSGCSHYVNVADTDLVSSTAPPSGSFHYVKFGDTDSSIASFFLVLRNYVAWDV